MENRAKVLWAELFPDELLARLEARPVVYLPMGLCEPHGHGAAMGLDTLKAEGLCVEAARRFGGVVAPSQGYHIHETGYHARWLEDVVGEVNPRMTAVPPGVLLHFFLYQLRAFHNAGFRVALVLTGHSGGNERDLRLAAEAFMLQSPMKVVAVADSELVAGQFPGDHAGRFELSQLMALRPELVDPTRASRAAREPRASSLGRFAQGDDASEASLEYGRRIVDASLSRLRSLLEDALSLQARDDARAWSRLDYPAVEHAWQVVLSRQQEWVTSTPAVGQLPVTSSSQWKAYESSGRS